MPDRKGTRSRESSCAMSVPWIRICPEFGLSRRVTQRATVDFPDPDSPTSASVCPRGISKSTHLTAATGTRLRHRLPRTYRLQSPLTRSKLWTVAPWVDELVGKLLPILEAIHGSRRFRHELARIAAGTDVHAFGAARLKPATNWNASGIGRFTFDRLNSD